MNPIARRRTRRGSTDDAVRDDRVLTATRWVARLVAPVLAAAFLVLYGMPDRTTEFFAWTIRPEMTPVIMGAGYGAGVYFFYRVSIADEWHRVAAVFPGIATFTWCMAVATALHWANFNHGHHTFALWVFLYAVTPVLVPALWAFNRRTDPVEPARGEVRIPEAGRWIGGGLGIVVTGSAAAIFVFPAIMIDAWPWTVSPLTARILAGWFALFGVVNGVTALDRRWSAWRIPVQSQLLGFSLVLIGAARAWHDFDTTNPLTWGVVGGMSLYLAAVLAFYLCMEARGGGRGPSAPPTP